MEATPPPTFGVGEDTTETPPPPSLERQGSSSLIAPCCNSSSFSLSTLNSSQIQPSTSEHIWQTEIRPTLEKPEGLPTTRDDIPQGAIFPQVAPEIDTITTSFDEIIESLFFQVHAFVNDDPHAPENKDPFFKTLAHLDSLLDLIHVPQVDKIVNLSSRTLNQHEFSLLSRGLNFCPTPGEPKRGDLVRDLDYFHDNLRLEYHFKDNPLPTPSFVKLIMTSKVFKKTDRPPPPQAHKNLEAFYFLNERDLQRQTLMEPRVKNLSKEEKGAIRSLKQDPSITIKSADKGGAVVILNTEDYVAEANRQLSDRNFYLPLARDQSQRFNDRIETYLASLLKKEIISKASLRPTHQPTTPAFYHNPKIHKPKTSSGIPPGRPIISGNGCATEKILALVDLCINPLVPLLPSYVKDSTHFLSLLQDYLDQHTVGPGTLLVTLDVSALYTFCETHRFQHDPALRLSTSQTLPRGYPFWTVLKAAPHLH